MQEHVAAHKPKEIKMKKFCFFLLIIFLNAAVFGQETGSAEGIVLAESVETGAVQADAGAVTQADIARADMPQPHDVQKPIEKASAVQNAEQPVSAAQAGTAEPAQQPAASRSITKYQPVKEAETVIEMNEPTRRTKRRSFSLHTGFNLSAAAANNIVSLTDFFQEKLVIDLNKLAKKTIWSGIHVGNTADLELFWRFTVVEEHTVKFSTTVSEDVWFNIPKSILDLAANGNAANAGGKAITGNFNAKANVFVDTGVMYQMTKPKYSFAARLAYFVPVAYMENPEISYRIAPTVDKDGNAIGLEFKAKGTARVYGYIPGGLYGGDFPSVTDILKAGGLDISISGSYRPTNWVNITGGIDYLPLKAVPMTKGIQADFEAQGSVNNILEHLGKATNDIFSFNNPQSSVTAVDLPKKNIMRPGKIRIGADFRPFENNYMIVSPFIAFPFINAKPYYIDGGIKLESCFARALGASLSTACIERIWRHELMLFLDSRFFSLTFGASITSQSFTRTFHTLSGLGFKFGMGIGL